MDSSAIKEIQLSQSIRDANASIKSTHVPVVSLPSDFKLHSLEQFQLNRSFFRGELKTNSVEAFRDYAVEHSQEGSTCYIDSESMTAEIIFDLGHTSEPGHCMHKANLKLIKTSPFDALLKFVDLRKSQREVAEFIEDWRHCLTASGEPNEDGSRGEKFSMVRAINAVRKISIEAKSSTDSEVRQFGASATSMESIDVAGIDQPPAFFHFTCEPYQGLSERTFDLRLSVITERTPALVLRIVRFEEHEENMAEEFQTIIEQNLLATDPAIKTYIGSFR